ncbi:sensor histidine kinase [Mycolicibacterium aichiense]|uniref:sensor histidine kinase n=1 Tax=Mycolicibacterium aichiense TaxID=1799 RepID=UPI003D67C33F
MLLNEVRSTWQGRLARTGRALRITADTDLPSSPASIAAVRQIVAVLIDNAVSHGVGTITVHARRADSTTAIDVSDEGTQLRQHDEAILFQGRDTNSNHGIGLPLARSLADAQGGRLRLTATSPTTFTLFLPTQP